ncbi:MAG TPA: peptide ABC transporter substrate-binding protein [Verrucomicrobiae bacterium]|nr:peptide ABC transporter substrate-binding protein [Verrucomicrobiae bacterium]
MSPHIPESDWRQFKKVHGTGLERFCARTMQEVEELISLGQGTAHERYLQVYELLKNRDKELARAFDDFRRSTAVMQLIIMRSMRLLSDEDLAGFSEQTQAQIRGFLSVARGGSDESNESI